MRVAAAAIVLACALTAGCGRGGRTTEVWSPSIAYAGEFHAAEIYSMSADGMHVRRLTHDVAPDRWPTLSPDGSLIAFSHKTDGAWTLFTMHPDGSGLTNVSAEAGFHRLTFAGYPDWSPDGSELAFSAARPLATPHIVVWNLASQTLRDLTPSTTHSLRPRWSPDGKTITFAAAVDDKGFDIYVVRPDGTRLRRLTRAPGWQFEPTWSPDGLRIAYTAFPDDTSDIYVMNADGSGQHDVTNTHGASDTQPSWSTRGIAFRSDRTGVDGVYVMAPNGSGVERISPQTAYDEDPRWSADGRRILFTSGRNATSAIMRWDPRGAPRPLTHGPWFDTEPAWSPDGGGIAFTRSPSRTKSDIWVMDGDGDSERNLTAGRGLNSAPAWSPDGQSIAFTRVLDSSAEIWMMNADGTGQHALTPFGTWSDHPTWSPDGQQIAYSSKRGGKTNIYIRDLRSGSETRLTKHGYEGVSPAWSPDGRQIVFVAQRPDSSVSDLWLVNVATGRVRELTHSADANTSPAWLVDGFHHLHVLYVKEGSLGHDSDLYEVTPAHPEYPEAPVRDADWPETAPNAQAR